MSGAFEGRNVTQPEIKPQLGSVVASRSCVPGEWEEAGFVSLVPGSGGHLLPICQHAAVVSAPLGHRIRQQSCLLSHLSPGPEGNIVLAFPCQQEKCELTEVGHQYDTLFVQMVRLLGRESVGTGLF